MNCAPITVEAAKKKRYMPLSAQQERRDLVEITKRDDLPEMFVANINGCTTKESVDVRYPDAGKSVDYAGDPQNLMKVGEEVCSPAPSGENVKAGSGSSGDSGSSGSASSGSSSTPTPGASPSPSTPESTPAQTHAAGAGAGISVGAGAGASAGGGAVLAPTPSSGDSETPASSPSPAETPASSPASGSGSGSGSSGSLSGKCDSEGAWNCIGGSSFQRCANGQWSAAQQMAAGVQCTPGQSANLEMKAKAVRDEPIARRHAHVHLGHIGH
ncbi:hypothetical protein KEM55_000032 [Ascosphaera atra]|nr:hypothetical protein KEM55_000032 [Ascosphaera atra]